MIEYSQNYEQDTYQRQHSLEPVKGIKSELINIQCNCFNGKA